MWVFPVFGVSVRAHYIDAYAGVGGDGDFRVVDEKCCVCGAEFGEHDYWWEETKTF